MGQAPHTTPPLITKAQYDNDMKKYVLTEETKILHGSTLYRVKALKDFGNVKAGDLGGFVEDYKNLSQRDLSWVADEACVYNNAEVGGNAKVLGNARVFGNAEVRGNAKVLDNAEVFGYAEVFGKATVRGNAKIYDVAMVYGTVVVEDEAEVFGNATVRGNAKIYGFVKVYGAAEVYGNAELCSNAEVCSTADYIVFKNWWSSGRYFTWTRSNNKWRVGCFYGTGADLIARAYKNSETSEREYKRVVEYVESILTESKEQ